MMVINNLILDLVYSQHALTIRRIYNRKPAFAAGRVMISDSLKRAKDLSNSKILQCNR
jgi:hypothetical protein